MKGINKIIWGLVFALFNINFGFINLLPDVIGYAMIAYGASELGFEKAKKWAVWLALLSFPSIINLNGNLLEGIQMTPMYFASTIYHAIIVLFHIVLIYEILKALIKLAEQKGLETIVGKAKKRINQYTIITIIYLVGMSFVINMDELISLTFLVLISVLIFIMEIIIIFLIREFSRLLVE
ncbi:hypothetical protein [Sutcliffiella deserti]|uniref:hypothetical protein n=1 Tax=Sutcliffiella deserti TaxID=2875501 RepID=UPI001CBC15BD|nr:hypothetical protein [Sutcliffiella deserti]